jgi:hypothetical protein
MKKLRFLSLVGITSIALVQAGWAAGHAGGGGGFGGGGFGGGHAGGPGGGSRGGFGGTPQFGGGPFGGPHVNFGGAGNRGGGVGFGMHRSGSGVPRIANGSSQLRSFAPSRSPGLRNSGGQSTRGLTNVGRGNRTANNQGRAATALNRRDNRAGSANDRRGQASRASAPRPSNEAALNRQHHIFARENGFQHRDWDRRHAHFFNGHWWCWDGGFWIGLDDGFYPWDFYPYYASDYYPYDYYTDVEPVDPSYAAQQADPNVSAVQSNLAQLGYYNGPIDGLLGADTRTALTRYQIDRGLQVTGSLTTDTMQSLGLPQLTSS